MISKQWGCFAPFQQCTVIHWRPCFQHTDISLFTGRDDDTNGRSHHSRSSYQSHHDGNSMNQWIKHAPRPRDRQGNLLSQEDHMMAEYVNYINTCASIFQNYASVGRAILVVYPTPTIIYSIEHWRFTLRYHWFLSAVRGFLVALSLVDGIFVFNSRRREREMIGERGVSSCWGHSPEPPNKPSSR